MCDFLINELTKAFQAELHLWKNGKFPVSDCQGSIDEEKIRTEVDIAQISV